VAAPSAAGAIVVVTVAALEGTAVAANVEATGAVAAAGAEITRQREGSSSGGGRGGAAGE
jgi:hypothetical protein